MGTSHDDWKEFAKRLNFCAVCLNAAHPPDDTGKHNFVQCEKCEKCETMLVFDSFGRLHYSVAESLESFLSKNRVFSTIPDDALTLLPQSVARENYTIPIAVRDEILIVGMVHPVIDVLSKIRFVLSRGVLAVKIADQDFARLIRSYEKFA